MKSRSKAVIVLFFGILAASTAAIMIRFAQNYTSSLVIAAYRLFFAAVILLPLAGSLRKKELSSLQGRDLVLMLLAGLFLAIHFAFWITSLEFTSVASSVVFVATTPLWVALLSPLFLKEPIQKLAIFGMVIAILGGMVVGLSDACFFLDGNLVCPEFFEFIQGKALLGNLLALMGALMAALYLMIGRKLRAKMSLLGYIFVVYGMAAAILICIVLIKGDQVYGFNPIAYLLFLALAIFPQLLGHTSFNWSLRYLSVGYVSIALLGEPIGSTIFAYLFLGEAPGLIKILGALLILTGIVIAARAEKG